MGYPPPPPGAGPPAGPPPGGYGPPAAPPPGAHGPTGPPGAPTPRPSGGLSIPAILSLGVAAAALILFAAFVVVRLRDGGDEVVALSRAELQDALLTTDDLDDASEFDPGGERLRPEDVDDPAACRRLLEQIEDDDHPVTLYGIHDGDVEVALEDSGGNLVGHILLSDEPDLLDVLRRIPEECDEVEVDDEDDPGTVTVDEGDPIDVGDDSVVLEYASETEDGDRFEALVVAWERDGTVSELSVISVDPDSLEGVSPDRDLAEALAEALDDRLADVIAEAR